MLVAVAMAVAVEYNRIVVAVAVVVVAVAVEYLEGVIFLHRSYPLQKGCYCSNVGQLQVTDSNTCGYYALFFSFARARGKSMESFTQPFKYLRDVDNDQKKGETLRKLVTRNVLIQDLSGSWCIKGTGEWNAP